jgi:hypothetical protein
VMRTVAITLALAFGNAAAAEIVVREFGGVGAADTASFMVRSPWLVEWYSRPPTAIDEKPAHLEVHLYDSTGNLFVGRVVERAGMGRGDVLIEHSGRFFFRVRGQATEWQLKVIQIDEEVAERLREGRRSREAANRRR